MNSNLRIGDCVNPVTGGYLMTVRSVDGENVQRDWFDDEQHLRSGVFKRSQLKRWVEHENQV